MDNEMFYEIVEKAKKYDQLAKLNRSHEVGCSFCGKSQSAVKKIVAGPGVFICDECVELCNEILNEEEVKEEENQDGELSFRR